MNVLVQDCDAGLLHEHRALVRAYGEVQARCSRLAAAQAAEIERLRLEVLRLRAAAVVRASALAWALEDQDAAQAAADRVVCQTGCLSHGACWRAWGHCRRTGGLCVLVVPHPDATPARAAAAGPTAACAATAGPGAAQAG